MRCCADNARMMGVFKPSNSGGPIDSVDITETTKFGEKVGNSPITWWVFTQENNAPELRDCTIPVETACRDVKHGVYKLKKNRIAFDSYEKYIDKIIAFANEYSQEIETIVEYVIWLNSRNILLPGVIFTYENWPSTRLGDLTVPNLGENYEEDDIGIENALLHVLGLGERNRLVLDLVYSDLEYEAYDRSNPENGYHAPVDINALVPQTTNRALSRFAEYFTNLLEALRLLLREIDRFFRQSTLLEKESFWQDMIFKAMEQGRVETDLWDFKEKLSFWD